MLARCQNGPEQPRLGPLDQLSKPWQSSSHEKAQRSPASCHRKLHKETQAKLENPMRTAPHRQMGGDPTEPVSHGSFTQFWVTQPVALTSNLSRFMTHSSFCAPSMNSDKVIWPVGAKTWNDIILTLMIFAQIYIKVEELLVKVTVLPAVRHLVKPTVLSPLFSSCVALRFVKAWVRLQQCNLYKFN